MIIKQIYTKCLAQASYYIESNNECIIIDPIRDIDIYIDLINQRKVRIKYILETHFHADFISGHLDLYKKYKCPIVYGPNAKPNYEFISKKDGDELYFGNLKIKVIHTPGHTLESVCYLLFDKKNIENSIFTGDTLFIGDVGIPDVAQRYDNMSKEELASKLYDSLMKIMKLPDNVIIYPGHGKGTQCGKNLSSETKSTIGKQKLLNYALKFKNKHDFINSICSNIPKPPKYFIESVRKNINGYDNLTLLLKKSLVPINVDDFKSFMNDKKYVMIDTRNSSDFAKGHIKNSINIGLNGSFAISAGNLVDVHQNVLIICNEGEEEESMKRLMRVGFDNIIGYLIGSFINWKNQGNDYSKINQIESKDINGISKEIILDVRTKNEYANSHCNNSLNMPLYDINFDYKKLDKNNNYLVHCQSGYRSMIASSILKNKGFNVIEIKDGFNGIKMTKTLEII